MLVNQALPISLNVGLNLWLIPRYGVLGAAAATSGALAFMSLLELLFARRIVGVALTQWWALEPLLVSAGSAGVATLMAGFLPQGIAPLLYRSAVLGLFTLLFALWLRARGRRLFNAA
jgi:O-antigen/teichoic acid export membrane protein